MKKATFITTLTLVIATSLFGGCGSNRDEVNTPQKEEVTYVTQEQLNTTMEEWNEAKKKEIQDLKETVETLTAKVNKQKQELSKANERIAQLEGKVPEAHQETQTVTPQIVMHYLNNSIEILCKSEADAFNYPINIYQNVKERNISFDVSGIAVKEVYVNQGTKIDVSWNDEKKVYRINYEMPGEGKYVFRIISESGESYYISVNY